MANELNTISMLGQAYSLWGFQIVDGVVGAGYPQKPKHSDVFAQIFLDGSRLTELARRGKPCVMFEPNAEPLNGSSTRDSSTLTRHNNSRASTQIPTSLEPSPSPT